jgi:hypothetical protein
MTKSDGARGGVVRLEPSAPRSRKVRVGRLGMRRGAGSVSRYAAPDKRIAASPTSTPNNGKAPRYAKSRRGPSAQTGQGQKERHLVSVYPRASFLWRKVSLQIDIAPSGCSAIRRNRKPQSRGRDSDSSSIKIHFVVARHPPERSISSSW